MIRQQLRAAGSICEALQSWKDLQEWKGMKMDLEVAVSS